VITFNVLFTPGSVGRLLPFALSLLQGSGVRVRVVANGCGSDEVDLMRAATRVDQRMSHYVLPNRNPIEHGQALNRLFEAFDEPHFAIADSDVIADGDFMDSLQPIAPGTAVFSATPVWVADGDAVLPAGTTFLSGRQRSLEDGTPIGSTYLAVYERATIEPLWRQSPRGFGVHFRHMLPREMQTAFSERGWRFRMFDSCRLVNLLLLVDGHRLENRSIPELHHVGGYSVQEFESSGAGLRNLIRLLRWREERSLQRIIDGLSIRLYARLWRDPRRAHMNRLRRIVLAYVDVALDAIVAGRPAPPAPVTGSAEVDRRVAALVSALEESYPPALSALNKARHELALSIPAPVTGNQVA
jgi:hypothetical protein